MVDTTYYATVALDHNGEQTLFQVSPFASLNDAIEACAWSYGHMSDDARLDVVLLAVLECTFNDGDPPSITFGKRLWTGYR